MEARPPLTGRDRRGTLVPLLLTGAALLAATAILSRCAPWRWRVGAFDAAYALAWCVYAVAVASLPRWRGVRHAVPAMLLVALALRIVLVPLSPSLSDDLYRYLWDGRVLAHGLNPYAHAPDDPALAALREPGVHALINHPGLRTIYPPVAEAGFALVASLPGGVLAMKIWVAAHDLLLAAALSAWLARRGRSGVDALVYAWNPLVLVEYAGSGHHDPTGMLWWVLALMWVKERPVLSATAFGLAVLVKLAPIVSWPFLVRDWTWRARAWSLALTGGGLAAYARLASGPRSGLAAFAQHWRHNDSLFHGLALAAGDLRARWLAAALLAGVVAWRTLRRRPLVDDARIATRASLLLGPVLHPWYVGWALVFEPLRPSAAWLVLTATVMLAYGGFRTPADPASFHPSLALRALEYGLPLAVFAVVAAGGRGAVAERVGDV